MRNPVASATLSATTRTTAGAATTALLIGCFTGVGPLTPAPAPADDDLHNVTYLARVDGVAPGGQATFKINEPRPAARR